MPIHFWKPVFSGFDAQARFGTRYEVNEHPLSASEFNNDALCSDRSSFPIFQDPNRLVFAHSFPFYHGGALRHIALHSRIKCDAPRVVARMITPQTGLLKQPLPVVMVHVNRFASRVSSHLPSRCFCRIVSV
jgi:hypothetical protein